jgi:S1-C subfamily serine protease
MSLNIINDTSVSTRSKAGHRNGLIITLVTVTALFVLLLAGCAAGNAATLPQTGTILSSSAPLYDENTVVSLYQRSIPSVVQIETVVDAKSTTPNIFGLPTPTPRQQRGQGSGFFIDNEGHILTNNHVVDGATKVTITLANGKTSEAKVIGTDRQNDLALIQATNLGNEKITALPLGDSEILVPGHTGFRDQSPWA